MKLSIAAEYAVRGALVLAERHGEGPINLDTICAARQLPKDYMTKIFASLAKASLITPIRGKHGGYTLARDPAAINLLQVIEAVEPILLNPCQHDPPQCSSSDCRIRPVWGELQQTIREKLASMTLARCLPAKTK